MRESTHFDTCQIVCIARVDAGTGQHIFAFQPPAITVNIRLLGAIARLNQYDLPASYFLLPWPLIYDWLRQNANADILDSSARPQQIRLMP